MTKAKEDYAYTDEPRDLKVSYAYIHCPGSNSPLLAVSVSGLEIYSVDDSSFVLYILNAKDGQLSFTYEGASWPRSYLEMNCNGYMKGMGSGGAGDFYFTEGCLDSEGNYQSIYQAEQLSGWWINYLNDELYNEVYGSDNDPNDIYVTMYTIDSTMYYTYSLNDGCELSQLSSDFIDKAANLGITWTSMDTMDLIIQNKKEALGADLDVINADAPTWTHLN